MTVDVDKSPRTVIIMETGVLENKLVFKCQEQLEHKCGSLTL